MPSPLPAETARPAPVTPDGRYLVVRGRLWRRADPGLPEAERERLVHALMTARRGVAAAKRTRDPEAEAAARAAVDLAKHGLGERGPVWWTDGAPDLNRHMARTTPYAEWYAALAAADRDGAPGSQCGDPPLKPSCLTRPEERDRRDPPEPDGGPPKERGRSAFRRAAQV